MALPDDREQLRRSFISIFVEHPVITLLAAMLAGALVFAMYLKRHRPLSNYAGRIFAASGFSTKQIDT